MKEGAFLRRVEGLVVGGCVGAGRGGRRKPDFGTVCAVREIMGKLAALMNNNNNNNNNNNKLITIIIIIIM